MEEGSSPQWAVVGPKGHFQSYQLPRSSKAKPKHTQKLFKIGLPSLPISASPSPGAASVPVPIPLPTSHFPPVVSLQKKRKYPSTPRLVLIPGKHPFLTTLGITAASVLLYRSLIQTQLAHEHEERCLHGRNQQP